MKICRIACSDVGLNGNVSDCVERFFVWNVTMSDCLERFQIEWKYIRLREAVLDWMKICRIAWSNFVLNAAISGPVPASLVSLLCMFSLDSPLCVYANPRERTHWLCHPQLSGIREVWSLESAVSTHQKEIKDFPCPTLLNCTAADIGAVLNYLTSQHALYHTASLLI